ncbi:MAG TPA: ATP-NAD kinase family protein [Thermoplasmata archaeon]|nr:ATP-NAD kinase family protein [Thermoplasmata archaeon]
MRRLGFIVNPIAGMGGRVGLKGTDGVVEEARAAGAEPVAPTRARAFAETILALSRGDPSLSIRWLTAAGPMGSEPLRAAGVGEEPLEIVSRPPEATTARDTRRAVEACIDRGAELVLFCGGDGTARDVAESARDRVPILGIPAGVKMHSAVFAVSPQAAAELTLAYLRGRLRIGSAEILDLDEDAYRRGEWRVALVGTVKTLVEPTLVQAGKLQVAEVTEESTREELADHFRELFAAEPDTLFFLGPGSTIASIASVLGLEKTLLGIDAVFGGRTIAKDVDERSLLRLLDEHPKAKLVVSPIGAQGFLLGRGNLEASPDVLRRIGTRNVIAVATPGKLAMTPVLRVDTGDAALDEEFRRREYLFVLIGYRTTKLHPIQR